MSRRLAFQKIRIFDILIIFFVIAAGLYLTFTFSRQRGSRLLVTADGKKYEYSASKDGIYTVQGTLGPTSFEIKNKKVRIIASPCPNKTCINQGWHSPIVCLPNNVIITLTEDNANSKEEGFDGISE